MVNGSIEENERNTWFWGQIYTATVYNCNFSAIEKLFLSASVDEYITKLQGEMFQLFTYLPVFFCLFYSQNKQTELCFNPELF